MKTSTFFVTTVLTFACCSSAFAKPKTTPSRQKAQCDSGVDLCDTVARDDLNNCNAAGQSNCSENYYEDINQCTSDYHDCLDGIAAVKGSALTSALSGAAGVFLSN